MTFVCGHEFLSAYVSVLDTVFTYVDDMPDPFGDACERQATLSSGQQSTHKEPLD